MKTETIITIVILLVLVLGILLLAHNKSSESFDIANQLETQILTKYKADINTMSQSQLQDLVARLRLRLDKFGLYPDGTAPDLSRYALKSEVLPGANGQCTVAVATDRDKYISKSDLPDPAPKVDLSKYVLKSSIPPEKVCPPQQQIDYSKYVLKSSLPPPQKCPPCICPKVKVSAGLCQKCPPPPKCPAPQPCESTKCPEVAPCPAAPVCPAPQACPTANPATYYDVKYIKVPTMITKTITVDANGNVINQKIQTSEDLQSMGSVSASSSGPAPKESSSGELATTITPNPTQASASSPSFGSMISSIFSGATVAPPTPPTNFAQNGVPVTTMNPTQNSQYLYFNPELNSEFKKTGIYGYPSDF